MSDPLRKAIQDLLDAYGDGWMVSEYAVCMGLERIRDGRLEYSTWHYAPPDQADWKTEKIIDKALDARTPCDWDDD